MTAIAALYFIIQCAALRMPTKDTALRRSVVLRGKPEDGPRIMSDDDVEYIPIEDLQREWLHSQNSEAVANFDERAALMTYLLKRQGEEEEDDAFDISAEYMDERTEIWLKEDVKSGSNDEAVQYIQMKDLEDSWVAAGKSATSFNEKAALMDFIEKDENDDDRDFVDFSGAGLPEEGTEVWIAPSNEEESLAGKSSDYMNKLSEKIAKAKKKKASVTDKKAGQRKKKVDKEARFDLTPPLEAPDMDGLLAATRNGGRSGSTSNTDNRRGNGASSVEGRSVGIDLGTTYSSVAVVEGGIPQIIPAEGLRITPSVVGYMEGDSNQQQRVLVGEKARRQLLVNPRNTFASVKRVIGRTTGEVKKKNSVSMNDHASLKVSNRAAHNTTLSMFCPAIQKELLPEEISTQVLRHLLDAAQRHLCGSRVQRSEGTLHSEGTEPAVRDDADVITKAVITVPAYFLPSQCEATERAGLAAGLTKVKLLREPEAAALAYGLTQEKPQIILVFDLGGGTFDCSVLEVGGGFVEVIATSGDNHLGGDDFDDVIVNYILDQVRVDIVNGADIYVGNLLGKHSKTMLAQASGDISVSASRSGGTQESGSQDGETQSKARRKLLANNIVKALRNGKDPLIWNRLHDAAVVAKCSLSERQNTTIHLPMLLGPRYNLELNITRKRFEGLSQSLLARILKPLREVAIMSGVNLPGESGKIGIMEAAFAVEEDDDNGDSDSDSFSDHRSQPQSSADSEELSESALKKLQASGRREAREKRKRKGSTTRELRRLQKSLGDPSLASFPGGQQLDGIVMVGGSTRIPAVRTLVKTITGADIRTSNAINPDEAVAMGAAVLAGILDGDIQGMSVMSAWQAEMYRAFGELTAKDFEEGASNDKDEEREGEASDHSTKDNNAKPRARKSLFRRLRK